MSPLFNINFRREAFLQEVVRTRRRVIALGIWVAYFGVLGIVLGLYVLNCQSLARRAGLIERQAARMHGAGAANTDWELTSPQLHQVEQFAGSTRHWRDRLRRLGRVVPPNAQLTGLTVNPQNLSDETAQNMLVIEGELRTSGTLDRMQSVMGIITALHRDSVFAASYRSIKLASTRVGENGVADFEIECR